LIGQINMSAQGRPVRQRTSGLRNARVASCATSAAEPACARWTLRSSGQAVRAPDSNAAAGIIAAFGLPPTRHSMADSNANANILFTPTTLGQIALANRVVMASLTRNRAIEGCVPTPLAVEYYRQRASAGLIIAEATQINPLGQGYLNTPGIYSQAQVAGWKAVTDAVHAAGGKIALQLWHVGRISHVSLLPPGEVPVAPSAIPRQCPDLYRQRHGTGLRAARPAVGGNPAADRRLPHRRAQRHRRRL